MNILRSLIYCLLLLIEVMLGAYAIWTRLIVGDNGMCAFFCIVTFVTVSVTLALYESANRCSSSLAKSVIDSQRDAAAANWTPEQTEKVREDRNDREGYETARAS